MMESAKQAGSEWEESQTNLQGQIDKITELREALSEGTLTEQEAADAKSELLSIQESLTDSYGDQVQGIDLINGTGSHVCGCITGGWRDRECIISVTAVSTGSE